jgi:hypothetical protein
MQYINVRESLRGNQKWTIQRNWQHRADKKSLKVPKGQSESVYRTTDNTMAKRKNTK